MEDTTLKPDPVIDGKSRVRLDLPTSFRMRDGDQWQVVVPPRDSIMRYKKSLTLTLDGERPISWNKLYAGVHWSKRKTEADRVHLLVRSQIDPNIDPFEGPVNITVRVYFKNKQWHDACNIPAKIYIDGLMPFVIIDDDPRFVASVMTIPMLDRAAPRVEIEVAPVSRSVAVSSDICWVTKEELID